METPLSPLDFARRTRRLHADREAVVDGDLRLTYRQFFDRCDRWSSALQEMGVAQGDRVATISPNTHAQLESFYSVPQLGAVLVPINYRLTAEDFVYIVNPRGVTFVAELPKTATGKIQKFVLRDGSGGPSDHQSKASARFLYSNSSVLPNHRFTSYAASSLLPEACTRLATALPVALATALDWCAKSPRIEPGWASFG